MQHLSLETAKKLHQLGFRKECEFFMGCNIPDGFYITPGREEANQSIISRSHTTHQYDGFNDSVLEFFQLPLAEELLEVLPMGVDIQKISDKAYLVRHITQASDHVAYMIRESERLVGDNLSEALALLLIELVEQGVVSKESLSHNV